MEFEDAGRSVAVCITGACLPPKKQYISFWQNLPSWDQRNTELCTSVRGQTVEEDESKKEQCEQSEKGLHGHTCY